MVFCVLCCAIMFLRSTIRGKDGKEHRYWSIVENRRLRDGRVVQRAVLYLGEINSSQESAWRRSIEVLDEARPHQGKWCFGKTPCRPSLTPGPGAREIPTSRR